jgi:hypothetical protein
MHGKDITIPKGTEITAYINGNVPLDLAKFAPPKMPEPVPAASAQATIQIESTPPGTDIELDGAFTGNTLSSIGHFRMRRALISTTRISSVDAGLPLNTP